MSEDSLAPVTIRIERDGAAATVYTGSCGLICVQPDDMPVPLASLRASGPEEVALLLMGVIRGVEAVYPGLSDFAMKNLDMLPGTVIPQHLSKGQA